MVHLRMYVASTACPASRRACLVAREENYSTDFVILSSKGGRRGGDDGDNGDGETGVTFTSGTKRNFRRADRSVPLYITNRIMKKCALHGHLLTHGAIHFSRHALRAEVTDVTRKVNVSDPALLE